MTLTSAGPIRAYLSGLGYPIDPRLLVDNPRQRPSTLCYLVDSGRLLMLRRKKEPFAGHWTAPGGKIIEGETPEQAIIREVHEETGLTISDPLLKAVCLESGDDPNYNWLLFIFRAHSFFGTLTESDEGELRWLDLDDLDRHLLPDIDRKILSYVLADAEHPQYIRVNYAADHSVETLTVKPLFDVIS